MTRLQRVIMGFNDYDNLIKDLQLKTNNYSTEQELKQLRYDISLLIGELKRFGCRRQEKRYYETNYKKLGD